MEKERDTTIEVIVLDEENNIYFDLTNRYLYNNGKKIQRSLSKNAGYILKYLAINYDLKRTEKHIREGCGPEWDGIGGELPRYIREIRTALDDTPKFVKEKDGKEHKEFTYIKCDRTGETTYKCTKKIKTLNSDLINTDNDQSPSEKACLSKESERMDAAHIDGHLFDDDYGEEYDNCRLLSYNDTEKEQMKLPTPNVETTVSSINSSEIKLFDYNKKSETDNTGIFDRDMSIEILRSGNGILTIPEGITELSGDFALVFDWMPEKKCQCSFREIRIPSSVQTINGICLTEYGPDEAPVKRFKTITVSKDNPYFTDIDGVLYSKDLTRLICYPCGKTGDYYSVPNTVEVVEECAFICNTNLRKINLPDSLRRIETHAFFLCDKLSSINLPYGLEYIGEECFELSLKINRLIVPLSVKKIFTSLFSVGSVIVIPHNTIELEYDFVPTEYLNMPFCGPAIISNDNKVIYDFAESYDYNHFENCYEDETGIIWADRGSTLVCFPADWYSEKFDLPDNVNKVYVNAFNGSSLKKFCSSHNVTIVGRTVDTPRYYEPLHGKNFHLEAGIIVCDDK